MNELLALQLNLDGELIHLALAILAFIGSIASTVFGGILVVRYQMAREREDHERTALVDKVDNLTKEVAEIRARIARCACADAH